MPASKLVLLYADYISHGTGIVAELYKKTEMFDGAFIWGMKKINAVNNESVYLDKDSNMPQKVFPSYQPGAYGLAGKYVFDHDLKEIVRLVVKQKEKAALADILNIYINRRKLFFLEYARGTFCSKVENAEILEKTDEAICLLEEIQQQKIGDFEFFRK